MNSRRGSLLIGVLLLLVLLLVGGLAMNTRQRERYKGAMAEAQSFQALALAEAGWEDARVKLDKDPLFPPPGGPEQLVFTYTEEVSSSAGARLGSYTVTVDRRFDRAPYHLLVITSVGVIGPEGSGRVSRSLVAEVSSVDRRLRALHHGSVGAY